VPAGVLEECSAVVVSAAGYRCRGVGWALVAAKRLARPAKFQALNQIRRLSFTAPDGLRQRLAGASRHHLSGV